MIPPFSKEIGMISSFWYPPSNHLSKFTPHLSERVNLLRHHESGWCKEEKKPSSENCYRPNFFTECNALLKKGKKLARGVCTVPFGGIGILTTENHTLTTFKKRIFTNFALPLSSHFVAAHFSSSGVHGRCNSFAGPHLWGEGYIRNVTATGYIFTPSCSEDIIPPAPPRIWKNSLSTIGKDAPLSRLTDTRVHRRYKRREEPQTSIANAQRRIAKEQLQGSKRWGEKLAEKVYSKDKMSGSGAFFEGGELKKRRVGVISITATGNNTLFTLSDGKGKLRGSVSAGSVGFRNSGKSTLAGAEKGAARIINKAQEAGFQLLRVEMRGIGYTKLKALRAMVHTPVPMLEIVEKTTRSHNGCRLPRKRRL